MAPAPPAPLAPRSDPVRQQAAADVALASALRLSVMRLARRLRQERTDASLSLSQLAALNTLERHGPLTPGELAAHERVQPPSMTRIVNGLEERALVARRASDADKRQSVVTLTESGRQVLLANRRRRDQWLAQRLAELEPAEREVLRQCVRILEKVNHA